MSAVRKPAQGLRTRLSIAFILQIAVISLATVLGVYAAATVLEDVLIRQALSDEARHFLQRLEKEPQTETPDVYNMRGYLRSEARPEEQIPDSLIPLEPGYHSVAVDSGESLVYVTDAPAGRLYLVFNQEHVGTLAFYFGFVPLTLVLVIIYLTAWLTYRLSRRVISPVIWLANQVRAWDPKQPDLESVRPDNIPADADGDVQVLAGALHNFAARIEEFVERERNFTRDASHELRSPLTVVKVAADVLIADEELSPFGLRSMQRIKRAVRDMEALIEAFLILAREGDTGLPEEDFPLSELAAEEIERARPLVDGKPVELTLDVRNSIVLHASPKVVGVLIGNLIRNACLYTDKGTVAVTLVDDSVIVEDTGVGMSPEDLERAFQPFHRGKGSGRGGHGVGLTIVRRLADRFGWRIQLDSRLGVGTRAQVWFGRTVSTDTPTSGTAQA